MNPWDRADTLMPFHPFTQDMGAMAWYQKRAANAHDITLYSPDNRMLHRSGGHLWRCPLFVADTATNGTAALS